MPLNYNNTFLCNPPALFHYKVKALALALLGLVIFIFLRLSAKSQKDRVWAFLFHCLPHRQLSGDVLFKRSGLKLGSFGLSLLSLTFSEVLTSEKVLSGVYILEVALG